MAKKSNRRMSLSTAFTSPESKKDQEKALSGFENYLAILNDAASVLEKEIESAKQQSDSQKQKLAFAMESVLRNHMNRLHDAIEYDNKEQISEDFTVDIADDTNSSTCSSHCPNECPKFETLLKNSQGVLNCMVADLSTVIGREIHGPMADEAIQKAANAIENLFVAAKALPNNTISNFESIALPEEPKAESDQAKTVVLEKRLSVLMDRNKELNTRIKLLEAQEAVNSVQRQPSTTLKTLTPRKIKTPNIETPDKSMSHVKPSDFGIIVDNKKSIIRKDYDHSDTSCVVINRAVADSSTQTYTVIRPFSIDGSTQTEETPKDIQVEKVEDTLEVPDIDDDDIFEKKIEQALTELSDSEGGQSAAAVARTIGRLLVLHESLESSLDEIVELSSQKPDKTIVTDTLVALKQVLEARLSILKECTENVKYELTGFDLDELVATRHEVTVMARKAKAMSGWLAVHSKSDCKTATFLQYEKAIDSLKNEINSLGGWRAAITLRDGSVNEEINPKFWPSGEANLIWERLLYHYVETLGEERKTHNALEDSLRRLQKKKEDLEYRLKSERTRSKKLEEQVKDLNDKSIDNEHSASFYAKMGSYLNSNATVTKKLLNERLVTAELGSNLANICQFALDSSLAQKLGLSPGNNVLLEESEDMSVHKEVVLSSRSIMKTIRGDTDAMIVKAPSLKEVEKSDRTKQEVRREKSILLSLQFMNDVYARVNMLQSRLEKNCEAFKAADFQTSVHELHTSVMNGIGNILSKDLDRLHEFIRCVVERDESQGSKFKWFEREIDILVRSQIGMRKHVKSLDAAYVSDDSSEIIQNLRRELALSREEHARTESALLVLQQTYASVGTESGPGRLELLEDLMRRHQEVSEIHGALLPRYDAVEAELYAITAKLKEKNKIPLSDLQSHSVKLKRQKAQLELRLFMAFREVEQIEKLLVDLYERVEAATQYIFSGANYRGMLLWAADKEAQINNKPPSPRLAAAARTLAPPVHRLLPLAKCNKTFGFQSKDVFRHQPFSNFPSNHTPNRQISDIVDAIAASMPNEKKLKQQYGGGVTAAEEFRIKHLPSSSSSFLPPFKNCNNTHATSSFLQQQQLQTQKQQHVRRNLNIYHRSPYN
uniref:Uncharacterized protein n=1 Tax=Aureoumbra lagunensis TaxID=44058 RepID=A0A7S3K516_9STRA